VFGGPGAWDNAQKAPVQCPKEGCGGEEAAYFQVQIRSADEPMTSFFKVSAIFERGKKGRREEMRRRLIVEQCMTCGNRWREN